MVERIATGALVLLLAAGARAADPLEVSGGLRDMVDRRLTRVAMSLFEERARVVSAIRTPAEAARRQQYIRERVLAALGGFPERTPLHARLTGTLQRDGYRVEKLIFESLPAFPVTANVYVPETGQPPYPALLGVAGHSDNGKASELYQRVWISLARRGILVIAWDPPGQGERSEYVDPATGRSRVAVGTAQHIMAGTQCLLTGTNFARYEIWDGIRAFDYLLTRSDVDPQRIGVAGNSGGGTQSAYLAVAEPRLAVAAPSCYITSWTKLWTDPGPQDAEQVFVDFLKDGLDFADFLIAFAPKPLQMATAIRDFFPIDGARAAFAEARRFYEILDAPGRVGYFEYDDTHGWSKPRREATYRFLERWLNQREDAGAEPDFPIEKDESLQVTPTGQVATSMKVETVASLNRALAERQHAARAAAAGAGVSELIARRLRIARTFARPGAVPRGVVRRQGYRIEKVALEPESGIVLPALVLVPDEEAPRRPAVLYLNAAGKSADAPPGGDLEALVRAGRIVLAVDVRGWGESGVESGPRGYTPLYRTVMRALLVGETLIGAQVADALAAFEYLAARPEVDRTRVDVLGKANGGTVALLAAALEPRLGRVATEGAVVSYLDVVRAPVHQGILDLVASGILMDFDLPDAARAAAVHPVWIVNPRGADGAAVAPETAQRQYGSAARVLLREPGASFTEVYAGWLR
jgi:cephalosporin-C deacetylase-like acetyl esterase